MPVLRFTLALILIGIVCFSTKPQARLKTDQQALVELEQRWLVSEDNADELAKILADDFIHVLPSGFVNRAEQLAYTRAHPHPRLPVKRHFEHLQVRTYGNTGIANGIVVATAEDGTVRKTIFSDVFAYRNGRWRAVNAQENKLTAD